MNQKKVLAQILAPKKVVPNAISIQAHQPDHIIFLRTYFPGQTVDEEDPSHNRLFAWLDGGEALISEYKDLNEPFPIRYTSPEGYLTGTIGKSPTFEVINLQTNDIKDRLLSLQQKYESDDLHFDLLPGAKSVKIPLLLSTNHWKMWYTTEAGVSIHCASNFQIETHGGVPLSLIDRSWLGGNPAIVERHFSGMPDEENMEFHKQISGALELEPRSGPIGKPARFNRPKTVNGDGFKKKLESLGYKVDIAIPKNYDADSKKRDMTISKGSNQISFNYLNEVGGKTGFFLEPLIDAQLWDSRWEPLETVWGMEVYEHSAHERKLKIIRQLKHLQRMWGEVRGERGGDSPVAASFERLCNKVDLVPGLDLDVNELATKILADTEMAMQELQKYTTICELDVLMLDSHGIVYLDGKARTSGYDTLMFSAKRPTWLMHRREYIVIPLCFPPKSFEEEPSIVHIDQIRFGRDVLADSNRCYPLPCPEIERAQSFSFENGVCSQPDIELVHEHVFQFDQVINSSVLKSIPAKIHIRNRDDFDFLCACKKLGHLDCPTFKDKKLEDFSSLQNIEISYRNMGIRIGKRKENNKINYFFTPKALDFKNIETIWKLLLELTTSDASPPHWPEWVNEQRNWRMDQWGTAVRIIILDEEIDQSDFVVIDTNPNTPEAPTPEPPQSTTKEELIGRIGNALSEILPCEWHPQAVTNINAVSTKSERMKHFGMKGAVSQSMAIKFLGEYIRIEGKGNDAIVHPAHPNEDE